MKIGTLENFLVDCLMRKAKNWRKCKILFEQKCAVVFLDILYLKDYLCFYFLFRKQGEIPYVIPLGGSNTLGTFGIINSFAELIEQVGSDSNSFYFL